MGNNASTHTQTHTHTNAHTHTHTHTHKHIHKHRHKHTDTHTFFYFLHNISMPDLRDLYSILLDSSTSRTVMIKEEVFRSECSAFHFRKIGKMSLFAFFKQPDHRY